MLPRRSHTVPALALALSCGGAARVQPAASSAASVVNPRNALSTLVTFEANAAGCASVVSTSPQNETLRTACAPVKAGTNRLPVMGLRPATQYAQVVELHAGGAVVQSQPLSVSTAGLPAALGAVHIATTGEPFDGFILTEAFTGPDLWAIAFDSTGAIRWYVDLGPSSKGDLKQQPNGNFTAYIGESSGSNAVPSGRYVELRPDGETAASWAAPLPLLTDNHELLLSRADDGSPLGHFFGYSLQEATLPTAAGGQSGTISMHTLLRTAPAGPLFAWSTSAVRTVADWIEPPFSATNADFDHPNSLQLDADGNYLASFRALGEVDLIDSISGAVLWTLGGTHATLQIEDDPDGCFSAQHSARLLADGNLLLYDNGWRHTPQETRAVEYQLDLQNHVARMVWQHHHDPPLFTPFTGSVQRLASGNTVVSFSSGAIDEVAPDGTVVWSASYHVDGDSAPFQFYRALRIAALDEYREP
jgi:hypothetical protein